ncbi:unnamed protein product, partial [Choristocarpus tenellus]
MARTGAAPGASGMGRSRACSYRPDARGPSPLVVRDTIQGGDDSSGGDMVGGGEGSKTEITLVASGVVEEGETSVAVEDQLQSGEPFCGGNTLEVGKESRVGSDCQAGGPPEDETRSFIKLRSRARGSPTSEGLRRRKKQCKDGVGAVPPTS